MNAIAYGWTREDFVQIITVPLTNEQMENDQNNFPPKNEKHVLEISGNIHDGSTDTRSLTESLYNSSSIDED